MLIKFNLKVNDNKADSKEVEALVKECDRVRQRSMKGNPLHDQPRTQFLPLNVFHKSIEIDPKHLRAHPVFRNRPQIYSTR